MIGSMGGVVESKELEEVDTKGLWEDIASVNEGMQWRLELRSMNDDSIGKPRTTCDERKTPTREISA